MRAKARLREVQYVAGELRIFQKCAIIQKSEIFAQSALKLGQNDDSKVAHFDQVS